MIDCMVLADMQVQPDQAGAVLMQSVSTFGVLNRAKTAVLKATVTAGLVPMFADIRAEL